MLKTLYLMAQSAGQGEPPADEARPQTNDAHPPDRGHRPGKQRDRTEKYRRNGHAGEENGGTDPDHRATGANLLIGGGLPATSRDRVLKIAPEQVLGEGGKVIENTGLQKASCGLRRFQLRPSPQSLAGPDQNWERASGLSAFKVPQ